MFQELLSKYPLSNSFYDSLFEKISTLPDSSETKFKLERDLFNILLKHQQLIKDYIFNNLQPQTLLFLWENRFKLSLININNLLKSILNNCVYTNLDVKIVSNILTEADAEFGLPILTNLFDCIPVTSEFKFIFIKYFDYWISKYDWSASRFLAFEECIAKLSSETKIYLSYVPFTSILYYEDIITKYKISGSVYSSKIPVKQPLYWYNQATSICERKEFLKHNQSFSATDLLEIYNKTSSKEIKFLVQSHPNCPLSLKLKQEVA